MDATKATGIVLLVLLAPNLGDPRMTTHHAPAADDDTQDDTRHWCFTCDAPLGWGDCPACVEVAEWDLGDEEDDNPRVA